MSLADRVPPLDDRSFDQILSEARARIPRYTSEWTDWNEGDPGIALMQLMAWMSELLLYRMNRIPALARLKFLDLIGIGLAPARPAEAFVTFAATPGLPSGVVELPRRTQVAAPGEGEAGPVVFETNRRLVVFAAELDAVQALVGGVSLDQSSANAAAAAPWSPFGESGDPGSALLLGFASDGPFPANAELALTFWLAQGTGLDPVACGALVPGLGAKLAWEGFDGRDWRALAVLKDETAGLARSGQVFLRTPAAGLLQRATLGVKTDRPRTWLRARVERKGWDRVPRLIALRNNTARASQGETIEGEVLGGSDATAEQTFRLASHPILADTLVLEVNEGEGEGFVAWEEVPDFGSSGPRSLHYVLDRGAGVVRFGDGRRGHIPSANPDRPRSSIRARSYRHGGGMRGNAGPGKISNLLTASTGIDLSRTTNLFAAVGGTDEETLAAAEERAGQSLKSRGRAVTTSDFEEIARSAGPVGRARALPLHHPGFPGIAVPGVVTVIVVPDAEGPAPMPEEHLLRRVCACLDAARLLTTEVYVVAPTYRQVKVSAELVAASDADEAALKEAALAALDRFFHPLRGGPDGKGWHFGGTIHFSAVHAALLRLPGAGRVGAVTIELDGKLHPSCTDVPIAAGALLASAGHEVSVLAGEVEA
jgi:predicted phage baseplate assembly protein